MHMIHLLLMLFSILLDEQKPDGVDTRRADAQDKARQRRATTRERASSELTGDQSYNDQHR
jgi:hypothetical protein